MNSKKYDIDIELEMKKSSLQMYLNTLDEMISRDALKPLIEQVQNEIKKLRKEVKELSESHYKSEASYKAFISFLKNRKKKSKDYKKVEKSFFDSIKKYEKDSEALFKNWKLLLANSNETSN